MTVKTTLHNAQQGYKALSEVWQHVKPILLSGQKLTLTVAEEKRNDPQNKRLHAMLGDIARQIDWAGGKRDLDVWKRLLTSAWLRARGESVEILPAVDGHGVDIVFRHTSKLTKSECAELITYIESWGAERGIRFTDPELDHA